MSVTVLSGEDLRLPPRAAALARFAVRLTAEPWSLTPDLVDDLAANGFDETGTEAAAVVVAMFNYLTRVADATGIEFDYHSPLPEFEPDRAQQPAPRPAEPSWPVVDERARTATRLDGLSESWQRWRGYLFESDRPLTRRERMLLAGAAARACCDRWRADQLRRFQPENGAESGLVDFAGRLSRQPWQMRPTDLDALRAAGLGEPALLHAICVVALQNAESRLAMARAVIRSRAPDPA